MSWINILTTWGTWDYITLILGTVILVIIALALRIYFKTDKPRLKPSPALPEASLIEVNLDPDKPGLINGPDLSSEPKPYLIEVVIISDGLNYHHKFRHKNLIFNYEYDQINYQVSEGHVFEKKPNQLEQLIWRFKGIQAEYLALFWEGESEPVEMKKSKVNPQVLARVRSSRALGKALREMFKSSILDNRGLLFFIIAFSVVAIFILRSVGYV